MGSPRVRARFKGRGRAEITVEGIPGPSCGDRTAWVEQLGQVVADEDTEEAFELVEEIEQQDHLSVGYGDEGGDDGW